MFFFDGVECFAENSVLHSELSCSRGAMDFGGSALSVSRETSQKDFFLRLNLQIAVCWMRKSMRLAHYDHVHSALPVKDPARPPCVSARERTEYIFLLDGNKGA